MMKSPRRIGTCLVVALLVGGLVFKGGCGESNEALWLEDWPRDLLVAGLAYALLAQHEADHHAADGEIGRPVPGPEGPEGAQGLPGAEGPEGPQGPAGPAGEQGLAGSEGPAGAQGEPGVAGLSCWDLDEDGIADPEEDANDDGNFDALDCQGEQGPAGSGGQGPQGPAGLSCWDIDGDNVGDPEEDVNGDRNFNALDCQGAPGPEFFDQFIDDFFTYEGHHKGELPGEPDRTEDQGVDPDGVVKIVEPALGRPEGTEGEAGDIAFRFAIPQIYDEGNDVTMRFFFYRPEAEWVRGDCLVFTLYALRLRAGQDIMQYGQKLWIKPEPEWKTIPQQRVAELLLGDNGSGGLFLVVDLPINSLEGLYDEDDWPVGGLLVGDMLAFEIVTAPKPPLGVWHDGGRYELLGVEFFESTQGSAQLAGATLFTSGDDVNCGEITDCNENGIDDAIDISTGTSTDCNQDGIPDDCQLGDNDCNQDGIPDDCQLGDNDCNDNGVPDECDLYMNDCNEDGIPDDCQLVENDCNANGIPDDCDIADGTSQDCQPNGTLDECDIAGGTSADSNENGIPDECE